MFAKKFAIFIKKLNGIRLRAMTIEEHFELSVMEVVFCPFFSLFFLGGLLLAHHSHRF